MKSDSFNTMNELNSKREYNTSDPKIVYFRSVLRKIRNYSSSESIAPSVLIKKGPREVKQSLNKGESRLLLVSGNVSPTNFLDGLVNMARESNITVVKFANSSAISSVLEVDFPVNIVSLNYLPESEQVKIEFYKNDE